VPHRSSRAAGAAQRDFVEQSHSRRGARFVAWLGQLGESTAQGVELRDHPVVSIRWRTSSARPARRRARTRWRRDRTVPTGDGEHLRDLFVREADTSVQEQDVAVLPPQGIEQPPKRRDRSPGVEPLDHCTAGVGCRSRSNRARAAIFRRSDRRF